MSHKSKSVVLGDRGRLVLPAEVRAELGLEKGSRFVISTEADGSMRLRPYGSVAESGRGVLAHLTQPGGSLAADLIEERRAEAARETEG